MHNFQGRLKEAREMLGLSQQTLAEQLNVSLRSQQNYEAGTRQPDAAYLTALAATGADVLYILTGAHDSSAPKLDASERVLLDSYRACPSEARQNLIQTAVLFAAGIGADQKATKNTKVKVSAPGGYAAGRDMQVSHREEKESEQANSRKPPRARSGP